MFRMRLLSLVLLGMGVSPLAAQPLTGTQPLTTEGDLATQMVAGIDKYLMRELAASVQHRQARWQPDYSSGPAYTRSLEPQREQLRRILGVVDKRLSGTDLEYVATTGTPALIAGGTGYRVYAVRWPVLEGIDAEGLLLQPLDKPVACLVALPDADWSPEMLVGLAPSVPAEAQFARRLAENGCQVLVPTLIDRKDTWSNNPRINRFTNFPHREFVYRMAFEMGRHIIGYEVQKVLAAVDWFLRTKDHAPVGVIGYGEGGLLALFSAAVDPRIQATVVSGHFGPREAVWQEPIYRDVWALLRDFGDAELAMLVAPRTLILEGSKGPEVAGPPPARQGQGGAASGRLVPIPVEAVRAEAERATPSFRKLGSGEHQALHVLTDTGSLPGARETLSVLLTALTGATQLKPEGSVPVDARKGFDPSLRLRRQFDQLCAYTQRLMREGEARRKEFWAKADLSSPQQWQASTQFYRNYLWEEVIGKLPPQSEPMNPRTRLSYDEPKWRGYEVTLDLYPDVFAYGILLLPKDLKPGERRPVVVCQHGLEGRPQVCVDPKLKKPPYNAFAAQLADKGFIVYAPQNPYIGREAFRILQRKAHPLKLALFSFILRQHERTLDWLAELPHVDPARIGFYGLSYGGKTAVRVPPLLERYALSICSADFNEWVVKTASQDHSFSYMFTVEYDMLEFNLGNTLNYAEMAMLMAPRPFMVERGHDDGVGVDEYVAYEYAKVRRLYDKLGLGDRTTIEFFNGGHVINGKETFAFLQRHLKWPQ